MKLTKRGRGKCVHGILLPMLVAMSASLTGIQTTHAAFTKTAEIPLSTSGNHHGLAFDGTNWHIASVFGNTFRTYDAAFNYLSTNSVSGVGGMRGLTYDRNSGHLFVGDAETSIVREVTLTGSEINQFTVPSGGLNALAYDPRDDTIWLGFFPGLIEKRTRAGGFISSFTAGLNWTGLAVDTLNDTLLALESNDQVYEYQFDGTPLGQVIATDMIDDNGQGLAYDSAAGRLYATTQIPGIVTIFDDPVRVPEPGASLLAALAAIFAWGPVRWRRSI